MPDNQQRKKSTREEHSSEPSTGRRGSHPQPERGKAETRGERKKRAVD
jgi:hypothetical protein